MTAVRTLGSLILVLAFYLILHPIAAFFSFIPLMNVRLRVCVSVRLRR